MVSLPLRIAILECDKPLDNARIELGGHIGAFTALFESAADALKYPGLSSKRGLELTSYDIVDAQEYPSIDSLDSLDGILVSGSRYNAFEDEPWILKLLNYVETILGRKRPRLLGVCFGHQIIARAMGAEVGRSDNGWEVSVSAVDLTRRGQDIFGKTSLAIQLMNRDVVRSCPTGVERLAYTAKASVHGMYVANKLLTIQGHPEFNEQIMKGLLVFRHDAHIIDDDTFEDATARADRHHDGIVVAQAFLRFLLSTGRSDDPLPAGPQRP
ncbi:hypothetical protein MMC13_008024 [Lambiella insularis]|nr:hypothetical protein [Lambiella insularis]